MSAFERLPESYRTMCGMFGASMGPVKMVAGTPMGRTPISAQNRRVRYAVDMHLASANKFPNAGGRQQRRRAMRAQ